MDTQWRTGGDAAPKVVMLVGDFVEDYEAMVPFQALQAMGAEVLAVSPGRTAGSKIVTAVHDFEGYGTYVETRGHYFELNADFLEICAGTADAVIIPGGRAAEYLRMDERVIAFVERLHEEGKIISALCHGVQLLTATRILSGRRATAYPAMRPELEARGARWVDVGTTGAVRDGNLLTGPGWGAQVAFLQELFAMLGLTVQRREAVPA